MPQQDSELLEVLLRQIAKDREVNGVLGEALRVLSQADRCEPLGDASHGTSGVLWAISCSAASLEKARPDTIHPSADGARPRRHANILGSATGSIAPPLTSCSQSSPFGRRSRKVASKGGMKVKERNATNVKRYLPIVAT